MTKSCSSAYRLINFVFAGIIGLIFIYSGIFRSYSDAYPLKCIYVEKLGIQCPSCGLSRGFSEALHMNFNQARAYNKHSIPLFFFFLVQFFLRIFKLLLPGKKSVQADVIISIALFVILFTPLIIDWLRFYASLIGLLFQN